MVPLFFVHVPKTGGTSLTAALQQHYPADRVFASDRLITPEVVERAQNAVLQADLITGHCGDGAAEKIRQSRDIRTITVLRDPKRHLISVFLHACRDTPGLFAFGLNNFMKSFKYYSVFQSGSLLSAFRRHRSPGHTGVEKHFGDVLEIVESLDYVSSLEQLAADSFTLASVAGLARELELEKLNAASHHERRDDDLPVLEAQYEEAAADPQLAYLLGLETAVYRKAVARFLQKKASVRLEHLRRNLEDRRVSAALMLDNPDVSVIAERNWKISVQDNGDPCWWTGEEADSHFLVCMDGPTAKFEFEIIVDHFVSQFEVSSPEGSVSYNLAQTETGRFKMQVGVKARESAGRTVMPVKLEIFRSPATIPKSPPWVPSFVVGNFTACAA